MSDPRETVAVAENITLHVALVVLANLRSAVIYRDVVIATQGSDAARDYALQMLTSTIARADEVIQRHAAQSGGQYVYSLSR